MILKLTEKSLNDSEEIASDYAKNIVKIARRIEFASIYPPNALNEMQEAILEFDDLQNKEQGWIKIN
jgi:taurine transport system permease protein